MQVIFPPESHCQNVVTGLAISALPANVLKMQILGLLFNPLNQRFRGSAEAQQSVLTSPAGDYNA